MFDYYFTAQLALVDVVTGARTAVGKPAIFERVDVSPGGENVLVIRTVHPLSYLVPSGGFPQEIDVWNLKGDVVRHIATLPSSEGVPIRGVRTGPRGVSWRPGTPATLVWAEALDGGDPRSKAEFQDRVVTVSAPFTAEPTQLARLGKRYSGIVWDTQGVGLLGEYDRERRWSKTWIVDAKGQSLGRLASKVANVLRGKNKATFTPHVDTGDFVVVINAAQVKVTGNKAEQKKYHRHTGRPGSLRSEAFRDVIVRRPEVPAVRGRGWVGNPVDAFLLARLEARGLTPNPPAPKRHQMARTPPRVTSEGWDGWGSADHCRARKTSGSGRPFGQKLLVTTSRLSPQAA